MGNDEAALLRLWREKRGEVEPEDLSGNLVVQNGAPNPKRPFAQFRLRLLTGSGFRRRTPGPPPSWSMNSTPAASKERLITSSVARPRNVDTRLRDAGQSQYRRPLFRPILPGSSLGDRVRPCIAQV